MDAIYVFTANSLAFPFLRVFSKLHPYLQNHFRASSPGCFDLHFFHLPLTRMAAQIPASSSGKDAGMVLTHLRSWTDLLERGEIGLPHRVETSAVWCRLRQCCSWRLIRPLGRIGGSALASRDICQRRPNRFRPPMRRPFPAMWPHLRVADETLAEDVAQRAYMTCGLCFALPLLPFARWRWPVNLPLKATAPPSA